MQMTRGAHARCYAARFRRIQREKEALCAAPLLSQVSLHLRRVVMVVLCAFGAKYPTQIATPKRPPSPSKGFGVFLAVFSVLRPTLRK